ncbi:multidrug ABC transporter ATPase/permease [Streptococcus pyogenes]|nr:multidrug ABC transporter ATPase/permease [Streptococcus pyogenes]VGQ88899.1 multidrug ABC transporter ATPase/permease [Streptococcus pyogenes]VGR63163.1 multidrug ABC transporter ATPase/permease [Streptococcus pyogenes]VGR68408.1 multidrug ABC transporter ATPase/permease [Streptococcus pyogenes]VGU78741.1 multidrug ABC transporter ATPase/permease [Streptococcus pyogenes]
MNLDRTDLFVNSFPDISFIYTLLLVFQTWYETFVRQRMLADLRRDIIKSYAANSPIV